MEYFTKQELVEMKTIVIKSHMQHRKKLNNNAPRDDDINKNNNNNDLKIDLDETKKREKIGINSLPNEVLLKIFSYLKFNDLMKSAKVSKKWNFLTYDSHQWRKLSFREWKQLNGEQLIDILMSIN